MRFMGFCIACLLAVSITESITRSLDCIGGEKSACDLISTRYAPKPEKPTRN
jgi:hypothetical protein